MRSPTRLWGLMLVSSAALFVAAIPACGTTPPIADAGEQEVPDAGVKLPCDESCADDEVCLAETCLKKTCANEACAPLEACLEDRCVSQNCVGVLCPSGMRCASGNCHPSSCGTQTCTANEVCINGACEDSRCVGILCPSGHSCANGRCLPTSCNGAPCPPGQVCESSACTDRACVGVLCPQGYACVAGLCTSACKAGFFASDAGCVPQKAQGTGCEQAQECESGHCADGVCCQAACDGPCVSCDGTGACLAADAGADEPLCGSYTCAAQGSCKSSCQGDGDCQLGAHCTDGGVCADVKTPGESCQAGTDCASGNCVDGVCCTTSCAGPCDSCNQTGSEGTCTPMPKASAGDPSCGAYTCDGQTAACPQSCTLSADCASTHYCDNNACVPKLANGGSCLFAEQCGSSHCANGYCCDQACEGQCEACNLAGDEGSCRPVPVGDPGSPTCAATFACNGDGGTCPTRCQTGADCAADHFCGADGGCGPQLTNGQPCQSGGECLSGACVDQVCCDGTCAGGCESCNAPGTEGTCTTLPSGTPTVECGAFLCDGTAATCPASCVDSAECAAFSHCDGGSCISDKPNGQSCLDGSDCASGHCADGVCCDGACTGDCERCDQTGAVGSCRPLAQGAAGSPTCFPYACQGDAGTCATSCDATRPCASGVTCSSGNTCDAPKPNGATCTLGTECVTGNCADGRCCDQGCGGACDRCNLAGLEGSCRLLGDGQQGSPTCAPLLCTGASASCPATCAGDQDCIGSHYCAGGTCLPKEANGSACLTTNECASGFCADGRCCNSACSGSCNSCDLATSPGTCALKPDGQAGEPACGRYLCNGTTSACPTTCAVKADCVNGYYCEGGACLPEKTDGAGCAGGYQCSSGNCVNGVCCNTACTNSCDVCNRTGSVGTCSPRPDGTQGSPSCSPYLCNGTNRGCPGSCAGDGDCVTGYFCNANNNCVQDKPRGGTCTRDRMCNSGHCVNGYCCDTACTAACRKCNVAGKEGTCSDVANGTRWGNDPGEVCCGGGSVSIWSNENHCGGCNSACGGTTCESVAATSTCSSSPTNVSGRCRCSSSSQCPRNQLCRTYSPYAGRCAPSSVSNCSSGESFVSLSSCPNYCRY